MDQHSIINHPLGFMCLSLWNMVSWTKARSVVAALQYILVACNVAQKPFISVSVTLHQNSFVMGL